MDIPLAHTVVGSGFNLVFCLTLEAAQAAMTEQVAAVVCGMHFAQGAAFELLRFGRSGSTMGKVSFYVLPDTKGRYGYSPAIVHGLRSAAKASGANHFTYPGSLAEKVGKDEAIEVLRRGLRDAVTCLGN